MVDKIYAWYSDKYITEKLLVRKSDMIKKQKIEDFFQLFVWKTLRLEQAVILLFYYKSAS